MHQPDKKFYTPTLLRVISARREMHEAHSAAYKSLGMSEKIALILCALAEEDGLSFAELAERTELDDRDVVNCCHALARDGHGSEALIKVDKSHRFAHRKAASLTDAGRHKHEEIMQKEK